MITDLLCDLDGVVWRAAEIIPGSAEALRRVTASGVRVWFVTNNSNRPSEDYVSRLAGLGVTASDRLVTSAMAAASMLEPGMRAMACAGPGVHRALADRGVDVVGAALPANDVDAVVVGLHRDFDYARLANASSAVRNGARFIGTNHDPTFPTPRGEEPGGGSILAAVATASAATPTLAGKPHEPMANLVRSMIGPSFNPSTTVMVGDRPSTDGRFAERLGAEYWQVGRAMSGEERHGTHVARVAVDLATLIDDVFRDAG